MSGRLLVFTRTLGYRHESIPAGIEAVRELAGMKVDATEEPDAFAGYDAVVFLNTSGDVLDDAGRSAFENYIRDGGNYVGVHGAADTGYDWPFYGRLVGAWFDRHPEVQPATVRVVDADHPATAGLDPEWAHTDEWYDFRANPRGRVRVLATVDESSYSGGTMGADHPIAWCHENLGGRAFYTALGHTVEAYADPAFRRHLAGGLRYAVGG
ncbi:ThuA domain-containing protein [Planosporangium mesophilum]|uniref:Crp/Fnr family transcriptional regulator n=1 Tax=Planosporangium mesophilum TaxID=689768 RepID=A0A8J3TFX8_9ACTN|nr:ThuA domain-containing protein [Planosporangium mesophilum]GII26198.1 Crp/Fnr family transcriptional regulator [Planosporangium mesophilum]